jgi:hypothetical protein
VPKGVRVRVPALALTDGKHRLASQVATATLGAGHDAKGRLMPSPVRLLAISLLLGCGGAGAGAPAPDLGPLGCAALYQCGSVCSPDQLGTCIPACIAMGSQEALVYFLPLQDCARPACYSFTLGGAPPPCAQPASAACMTCVMTSCKTQAEACLAH